MKFVHMTTERTWLLPNGLVPLANLVKKYGHDVEIIHYGIDPDVDLSKEDMVLFDLHWHDQAAVVIDKCKELKCCKILGGFTASLFSEEILDKYPIDYVLKGYAEDQLLDLLGHNDRKNVLIDDLEYTDFSILRNHERYLWDGILHFNPGRGCSVNCTYCGGNVNVQRHCGLPRPQFLSIDKVIYELKRAMTYGIESWLISFDPYPNNPNYYIDLFDRIDLDLEINFDCWGLPKKEFIDAFAKFKGEITISPRLGEKLRFKHKGFPFTDDELMETIDYIKKRDVKYKIFFSTNFPDDDITGIMKRIGEENCKIGPIVPEPGSVLFEEYTRIKSFTTLYMYSKYRKKDEYLT
jgi:radical SAM superfamily enzyme YgiQ (UPF0313 family)